MGSFDADAISLLRDLARGCDISNKERSCVPKGVMLLEAIAISLMGDAIQGEESIYPRMTRK